MVHIRRAAAADRHEPQVVSFLGPLFFSLISTAICKLLIGTLWKIICISALGSCDKYEIRSFSGR